MAFSKKPELDRLIARMGRGQTAHDDWERLFELLASEEKCVRCCYDFLVHGGATGDIELDAEGGVATIPEGAIITRVVADPEVSFTSGGAPALTLKLKDDEGTPNEFDFTDAEAIASFVTEVCFDIQIHDDVTGDIAASKVLGLVDEGTIHLEVATAALTAGKSWFYVWYIPGAPYA